MFLLLPHFKVAFVLVQPLLRGTKLIETGLDFKNTICTCLLIKLINLKQKRGLFNELPFLMTRIYHPLPVYSVNSVTVFALSRNEMATYDCHTVSV